MLRTFKIAHLLAVLGLLTACVNSSEVVSPTVPNPIEATVEAPTVVVGASTQRLPSPSAALTAMPMVFPTPDRGQRYWTLNITKEQYDQALLRWRSYAFLEYDIAFSVAAYTEYNVPEHLEGDYVMQVVGKSIKLLKRMPRYYPKPHAEGYDGGIETATASTNWESFLSGYTVDALFDRVLQLLNSAKPVPCLVDFDPVYSFPSRVICRENPDDQYESMDLVVNAFVPHKLISTPTP